MGKSHGTHDSVGNAYKLLLGKLGNKSPWRRSKMIIDVDWNDLAQTVDQW
jgi:hypothetical protein